MFEAFKLNLTQEIDLRCVLNLRFAKDDSFFTLITMYCIIFV